MSGGWQTQAYDQPAAFVAGDRIDNNPIYSYDAGPGALIAGPGGVTVGRFAWVYPPLDPNGNASVVQNFGAGLVDGFVMRNQQALNPTYLSFAGNVIQPGYEMALMIAGGFAAVNDGLTEARPGQKAFAFVATGKVAFAPAGTVFGGASSTAAAVAASTFSVTGSVAGNLLTVTVVGSGTLVNGASISGTGIPTSPAPKIVSQVTPLLAGEATGGVGRYNLNYGEITAASETISGTYGTLTLGGVSTVPFAVGDVLTGTGVVAGTSVTQILTGTGGGAGDTVAVDNNTVVSSTTLTGSTAIETKWYARSSGLPGEVVKMSSTPLG